MAGSDKSKVSRDACIELNHFSFCYADSDSAPLFKDVNISIPKGARVLFVGANGTGKSSLLGLLAGRRLVDTDTKKLTIKTLGSSPFHDLSLSRKIALVDGDLPLHLDLSVTELIRSPGQLSTTKQPFSERERELIDLLGIKEHWRMNRVSDGQRKRVQLFLALRFPVEILLLDEVTAHLDLGVRASLLKWLRDKNDMSIAYATHIFDGLDEWPTHILTFVRPDPLKPTRVQLMPPQKPLYDFALKTVSDTSRECLE